MERLRFLIFFAFLAVPVFSDHLKTLKINRNPQALQQQPQQPNGYSYSPPGSQQPSPYNQPPPQNPNQQYQQPPPPGYPPYNPYAQPPPAPPQQQAYPYPYFQGGPPQPLSQPPPQSLQDQQQQPQPGSARGARLLSPVPSSERKPVNRPTFPEQPTNNNGLHENNFIPGTFGGPAGAKPKKPYNKKYPLTAPTIKFKLGVISDPDNKKGKEADKDNNKSNSQEENSNPDQAAEKEETKLVETTLKEGNLYIKQNTEDPSKTNITIDWEDGKNHSIKSGYTYAGRGLELSTLNVFNGNLYACDDKTGIVYELPINETVDDIDPIPWVILADGNFTGGQGFKCEWATVKDGDLWIGGHGAAKYNEETGALLDRDDKFVKRITTSGEVTHLDWTKNFDKIAEKLNIEYPGYVIHEAGGWSDTLQKWIFMPRRISKEKFEEENNAASGANMIILADLEFDDIQVGEIGDLVPTRGFSGFKFIPGTGDQSIVALKTVENGDSVESYILAFDLRGNILLEETKFADEKFESIEFL